MSTADRVGGPMGRSEPPRGPRVRTYLALTYAISWSIWVGLLLLSRAGVVDGSAPLAWYGLGGLAPSLTAFVLTWRDGGARGVAALGRLALIWRVPGRWYLFALLTPTAVRLAGLALHSLSGGQLLPKAITLTGVVAALVMGLLVGAMEEFGWRGYLQPALREGRSAVRTGLLVGVAWFGWHVPLFWIAGTGFHSWAAAAGRPLALAGYALAVVSLAMLFAFQFERTRGSVLLAMILHAAMNASSDVFFAPYSRAGDLGPLWWSIGALAVAATWVGWSMRKGVER